ncbi:unnamed protein product [Caretta caretta]
MVASLSMLGPTIVYTRLPFCSQELDHLFGLINPLRKASCVDTSYLKMLDFILSSIVSWSSLTLTIESYTHIIATLLRIPSVQGPKKAFSTCVSHLTVVTLAYESSIFLHVRPQHNQSLASEKGASLLTEVVIPLLNPFIYSLRNDRVKEVLRDAIVRLMGCSKKGKLKSEMEEANETTVAEFMLLGFSGVRDKRQMFLFFVLLLTYLVTLTGNSLIIFIVWVDHRLHTPMYFFISNLSFLEIWFTSVTNPKMLLNFLSDSKTISFLACMAQSYFYFALGAVEFILLMVMSFDRYVAICHPL